MKVNALSVASPWLDAQTPEVRPLRYWRRADHDLLRQTLEALTCKWMDDWALMPRAGQVLDGRETSGSPAWLDGATVPELAASPWRAVGKGVGIWYMLQRSAVGESGLGHLQTDAAVEPALEPRDLLRDTLFGDPRPHARREAGHAGDSRVADAMADAAWQDWCTRLAAFGEAETIAAAHGQASATALPADVLRPWSGALAIQLLWCAKPMVLVFSGEYLAPWFGRQVGLSPRAAASSLPATSGVVPLVQALDAQALPLTTELAPIEIDLGTLVSLQVGDVLRTTHRLDLPLHIHPAMDMGLGDAAPLSPLCEAFLGKQGPRRAVELLRLPADRQLPISNSRQDT